MSATEFARQYGTTVYRKSIKNPANAKSVLKPGSQNAKLGFKVVKSKHKGKHLYSLTLVERSTCPPYCHHWDDCYGNNMPFAHRFDNGPELQDRIAEEVITLLRKHKDGILIRLHVLGDFYSVDYVRFWSMLLDTNHKLAIFGYTAYTEGPIFKAINDLNMRHRNRCHIRYSMDTVNMIPGITYAASESFKGESITCPEQTGKTESCATCGLCWSVSKTIRFLTH